MKYKNKSSIALSKPALLIILFLLILMQNKITLAGDDISVSGIEEITIGYFPNITHAPALVGINQQIFQDTLAGIRVKTRIFPNGSLFMDALNTGQIDLGYVGPGPAINRFLLGADVRALASASTGGTVLVTREDIDYHSVEDLKEKIVATAALGCTHDLLFRRLIQEHGLATSRRGGTIDHRAQKPATMLGLFATGQLDAAMVSEPWAARMEDQLDAGVVVDWDQVPWDGKLPAALVVSSSDFLRKYPEVVSLFLKAHLAAIDFINSHQEETSRILQQEIKKITRQKLPLEVINRALQRTQMTSDLDPEIIQELAELSAQLNFIKGDSDLDGFFELAYLKEVKDANSR